MLRGYYLNMDQNPNTLLTKFYGLYILKIHNKRIRVVVMKNFFPKDVEFDYKFDLKVSLGGSHEVITALIGPHWWL